MSLLEHIMRKRQLGGLQLGRIQMHGRETSCEVTDLI
jgi:hypothetical protein